ncbi:carnitine O-acetyltransferase [Malassezia psittaci]|uniref:Carnitine O-acetyltransferase, mitochondrial n=1 Tax=Malassezia psittaci TaxID=1821823 RepID=A0AAF0JDP6_9BASI|nr:carnitine O-acetyltransferase [Malassezia psittaci]
MRSFSMTKPSGEESKQLYSGQASLPLLPVPRLEDTLQKYLRTTLPLQKDEKSAAQTKQAVSDAISGKDSALVHKLQERLVKRATAEGLESWLYDWWLSGAYMRPRDPLVPFVSYFYLHRADPKVNNYTTRSAHILKSMMAFRKMVVDETLAPEKTKTGYMCMHGYKYLFNSCRIPQDEEDVTMTFEPEKNNHVVILRNGHFYEVPLVNPVTNKELSAEEIEVQIDRIVSDPRSQKPAETPIGAFTSDKRDTWAAARKALISGPNGERNMRALERIESSIIVLCLDDAKPISLEERGWGVWTGAGINRFYDKQQFIVAANGTSGYVGEHSMLDGTQTMRMNNFVLTALEQGKIDLNGPGSGAVLDEPRLLEFATDSTTQKSTEKSRSNFSELMGAHAMSSLDFQGYGKNDIKKYKCSPDAWVQMAIQLAYYRLYNQVAATYEAAQTRKFKLGRTETIRSLSVESKAFVEAMADPNVSDDKRLKLFQDAAAQHIKYAKEAAEAHGVDRHMLGLKKLLEPNEEMPTVFREPIHAESGTWVLSTSQISSDVFDAWGFGEVTPKGYGCAYAIKENSLAFTLVCLKEAHQPVRFTEYLNRALLDIRAMHDRTLAQKSKM